MIWLVVITLVEATVILVYGIDTAKRRWWNILIGIDQLGNAWAGGDPDETLSSRAAKRAHKRGWYWLGRFLEHIDPGHMKRSREDDEGSDAAWD